MNAPVNLEVLFQIVSPQDDDFHDVLEAYLSDTEKQLDRLKKAMDASSSPDIQKIAHHALGASLIFGMQAMADPLRRIETMGKNGTSASLSPVLKEARQNLKWTRTYLKSQKGVPC